MFIPKVELHEPVSLEEAGDAMEGALDMGEYLKGRWAARRRVHG